MKLRALRSQNVRRDFPSFWQQKSRFFMLIHQNNDVGLYGIKTYDEESCAISVWIFTSFRYRIPYKAGLRLVLNHPFSLGFKKVWIASRVKAVITLLQQSRSLGVKFVRIFNNKVWFMLENTRLV